MPRIFLTHPPEALANYYGERALAGLRAVCEVRLNTAGRELTTPELIAAAKGCELIVSYRQTPGEAALFAFGIAHSSPPNQSDDRRIAIVLRYIPPETRQTLSAWDSAALVRGQDRYNHFTHEPLPKGDFDDEAVAFHRRAEEQQRQIYYRDTGVTAHRT